MVGGGEEREVWGGEGGEIGEEWGGLWWRRGGERRVGGDGGVVCVEWDGGGLSRIVGRWCLGGVGNCCGGGGGGGGVDRLGEGD